ncbi:myb-like DNA-binding protein bas1 [Coemansia sp. RSA 1200]|nr:myb-like DNA-binding protein bas1 [Coemansia sp. RSA 1200]
MATHHYAPVSQVSLPPHSPSPSDDHAYNKHNSAGCTGPVGNNEHSHPYAHNGPRNADMYLHAGGAGNETRKQIGTGFSGARYNGEGPLPNQAEINAMDVAELRQVVSYLVYNRKPTRSPTPTSSATDVPPGLRLCSPTSPTFSSSSSYASASSLSTSAAFRRTPVQAHQTLAALQGISKADPHARKRVRHDSDTSATHRMGIDLLLNASTLSDRIGDCPRRLSPVASERGSWCDSHRLPRLPPISQLEGARDTEPRAQDMSASLPSPSFGAQSMSLPVDSLSFTMGSVGTSSLKAYKLGGGATAKGGCGSGSLAHTASHSQPFPPPLSTTRSQPGICQNLSPPASNHSSPNGITPADKMHRSSSYTSKVCISQIPSADTTPLPPTGDSVVCSDISRRRPYPATPATPSMHPTQPVYIQQRPPPQQQQQPQQQRHLSPQESGRPGFSFHQSPVLHHGAPTSPRNLYMQAQGYFSHQAPPQHSGQAQAFSHPPPPPMHMQHGLSIQQHMVPASMHGHLAQPPPPLQLQQHQIHNPEPMSGARNVSKPKFNYAFLDTKRPRGPSSRWTSEEDELLKQAVRQYGEDRQWVKVAQQVPGRSNLQCRQRWLCNIRAQVERERNTTSTTGTSAATTSAVAATATNV